MTWWEWLIVAAGWALLLYENRATFFAVKELTNEILLLRAALINAETARRMERP